MAFLNGIPVRLEPVAAEVVADGDAQADVVGD